MSFAGLAALGVAVALGNRGSQACVSFRKKPVRSNSSFATWEFSRSELGRILANWNGEVSFRPHTRGTGSPWVTAIARPKAALPIRKHLQYAPVPCSGCRVLYHGMGRDKRGLMALGRSGACSAAGYDRYSPIEADRKMPTGKFSEVVSTFTLNVLDQAEAKKVVREIHSKLRPGGIAVITTRRDVCKLKGKSLLPKERK